MTQKSNGGFYFSEEVGFEPKTKKNDNKKDKGDKKDDKRKGNNKKQKN